MSEPTRGGGAFAGPPPTEAPGAAELRAALRAAVVRVCPPWLADRADDLVQAATLRVLEDRKSTRLNSSH